MKIEPVDFFYFAMPQITTEADGSQDALLVRVAGGGHGGWGECEASPLVSIAAFVCPMSHGVCRPVGASVLGETLDGPGDIARIGARVAYDSMDLLQAPHTFSGVEMALWDLLGKKASEPVWRLLGYRRSFSKRAYASQLFVGFIQIDCGRMGGIGPAKAIADYAAARCVTFVNHTFTSHLAPRAQRLDSALCRARRPSPRRVSLRSQAIGFGYH
jgi:L-alanine-DL-glutamate epimerase-like enolase superfamily enzyme